MPRKTAEAAVDKEKELPEQAALENQADIQPPETQPADNVPTKNLQDLRQNLIDIGMDFSERLKKSQGVNETDLKNLDSLRVLYYTLAQYGIV